MRNYEREDDHRGEEICDCCGDECQAWAHFDIAEHLEDKRPTLMLCEDCLTDYQDDCCAPNDRERTALDVAEYEELQEWIKKWVAEHPDCPAAKAQAAGSTPAEKLCIEIHRWIDRFDAECTVAHYTPTDQVWDLLDKIRDGIADVVPCPIDEELAKAREADNE